MAQRLKDVWDSGTVFKTDPSVDKIKPFWSGDNDLDDGYDFGNVKVIPYSDERIGRRSQGAYKTMSIPIKSKAFKTIVKLWFKASVVLYNRALKHIKFLDSIKSKFNDYTLRDMIKSFRWFKKDMAKYFDYVPGSILDEAIFSAYRAYKLCNNVDNLKPRTFTSGSISFDGRCIKNGVIYADMIRKYLKSKTPKRVVSTRTFKNGNVRTYYETDADVNKRIRAMVQTKYRINQIRRMNFTQTCTINIYHLDTMRLLIPVKVEPKTNPDKSTIFCDVGVTPFVVKAARDKTCTILDYDWKLDVTRRYDRHDKLMTIKDGVTGYRKLGKIKHRIRRQLCRVKTKVTEVHRKVAKDLTKHKLIFFPDISSKQLLMRSNNNTMNRYLSAISLYRFKQYLAHKAMENGSKLVFCNESYTSKTCSGCGHLHEDLGAKKQYDCASCGLSIHRDHNGAINVGIRMKAIFG